MTTAFDPAAPPSSPDHIRRHEESRLRRVAETERREEVIAVARKQYDKAMKTAGLYSEDAARAYHRAIAEAAFVKAIEDVTGVTEYRSEQDAAAARGYRSAYGLPMPPAGHKPAYLPAGAPTSPDPLRQAVDLPAIIATGTARQAAIDSAVGRFAERVDRWLVSRIRAMSGKSVTGLGEVKSFTGVQVKAMASRGDGVCEAIWAVTGNEDRGGDLIVPGAFKGFIAKVKSGQAKWPRLCWEHPQMRGSGLDGLTGKVIDLEELDPGDPRLPIDLAAKGYGGVRAVCAYNLDTVAGRDAWAHVKAGDVEEWSFAYEAPDKENTRDGRILKRLDPIFEISNVLVGMNPETRTLRAP